ncbi:ICP0-binding domain of ubiquitin-specific protease 7 [Jimgerdemannia flammicorona]|uniref:ICP0-binding domain of ubiquitin-specific protease 7 n=1 Tax=Jimgerdemannia flammicorona TaxID=994334 RepID=A0A433QWL7_9FUNG|nr:ICP0-binding domain of ubiquitin-specific protease 7 [Jimgerdemannia flammicorona]
MLLIAMEFIQTRMDAYQSTLRLYLEETYMPISDKLSTLKGVFAHPSLMIFIKYFDPKTQIIEPQSDVALELCVNRGCGKLYVKRNGKVRDIIPILNMKKGFPLNTALKLFEEIKPSMIDPMKTPTTFQQAEIQDGDIICFQKEISDREAAEYKLQGYAATIIEFFGQLVKK